MITMGVHPSPRHAAFHMSLISCLFWLFGARVAHAVPTGIERGVVIAVGVEADTPVLSQFVRDSIEKILMEEGFAISTCELLSKGRSEVYGMMDREGIESVRYDDPTGDYQRILSLLRTSSCLPRESASPHLLVRATVLADPHHVVKQASVELLELSPISPRLAIGQAEVSALGGTDGPDPVNAALYEALVGIVGPVAQRQPELRQVPEGRFQMGSPRAYPGAHQHEVVLSRPFLIAVAPFQREADLTPPERLDEATGLPYTEVSWTEAIDRCNDLSRREGLRPAYVVSEEGVEWDRSSAGFRLPTEAEWEYAVRTMGEEAMGVGRVQEWVWDEYDPEYERFGTAVDPTGPALGFPRVVRGHVSGEKPPMADPWFRRSYDVAHTSEDLGFRVARSVYPVALAPQCADLLKLERRAEQGRLTPEERSCLQYYISSQRLQTMKDRASRLLIVDAERRGDTAEWVRLVKRHLEEISRADPELCYAYALHLWRTGGPSDNSVALYWLLVGLDNMRGPRREPLLRLRVYLLLSDASLQANSARILFACTSAQVCREDFLASLMPGIGVKERMRIRRRMMSTCSETARLVARASLVDLGLNAEICSSWSYEDLISTPSADEERDTYQQLHEAIVAWLALVCRLGLPVDEARLICETALEYPDECLDLIETFSRS